MVFGTGVYKTRTFPHVHWCGWMIRIIQLVASSFGYGTRSFNMQLRLLQISLYIYIHDISINPLVHTFLLYLVIVSKWKLQRFFFSRKQQNICQVDEYIAPREPGECFILVKYDYILFCVKIKINTFQKETKTCNIWNILKMHRYA